MDELQKWITLGGAVIAAVASLLNLWWTHSTKVDRIKVGFGPLEPPIEPGDWMYVESRSDHKITLKDYGFIGATGNLLSLPDLLVNEPGHHEEIVSRGAASLEKRGDLFEIGNIELRDEQIGAFAITVGQERYVLGFGGSVPWYKRNWIAIRIWWKRIYQ